MKPNRLEALIREQRVLNDWLVVIAFALGLIIGAWGATLWK